MRNKNQSIRQLTKGFINGASQNSETGPGIGAKEGRLTGWTQLIMDTGRKRDIKEISLQLLMKLLIRKKRLVRRIRRSMERGWKGVPNLQRCMLEGMVGQFAA